jgi:hypothetical protein
MASWEESWFIRLNIVPSQQDNSYIHSIPPTLFPLNLHNPRNGTPFSATQSLRISHFPLGLQHRFARKYLYRGLQEFTISTQIFTTTTYLLTLQILAHNLTHRPKVKFLMKLQLQQSILHAHYGCLQYPSLRTLFLSFSKALKISFSPHSNFLLPMQVDSHVSQC